MCMCINTEERCVYIDIYMYMHIHIYSNNREIKNNFVNKNLFKICDNPLPDLAKFFFNIL